MNTVRFADLNIPLPPHFRVVTQTDDKLVIEGDPPDNEWEKSRHALVTFTATKYMGGANKDVPMGQVRDNVNLSERRIMEKYVGYQKPRKWGPAGEGGVRDTNAILRRLLCDSSERWGWA